MNRGELEALGVMIGVVLGWSDSVRATVANHWSRTPSPTTTYQVAAAGGVHCVGSRNGVRLWIKLSDAGRYPRR